MSQITAMLNKLVTGGVQKAIVCGICYLGEHATDACPTLQGGDVNAMFLTKTQGSMTHTPTLIMKNGETTQSLGMDLGTTPSF